MPVAGTSMGTSSRHAHRNSSEPSPNLLTHKRLARARPGPTGSPNLFHTAKELVTAGHPTSEIDKT